MALGAAAAILGPGAALPGAAHAERPPECIADYCGPVCQFSSDPSAGSTTFLGATTFFDPAPTYPTNTVTICIEKKIVPAPTDFVAIRSTWDSLNKYVKKACSAMTYCDADGSMKNCKASHENVDPPRAFPPDIVTHPDGNYLHGCFKFECKPPGTPKGCDDDNDSTLDICHEEDGSCTHDSPSSSSSGESQPDYGL